MPLLETKGAGSAQGFGLSLGGEEAVYVEDLFSTYLYTGNGSTQTITNGIDLSGKGGLVWNQSRSNSYGGYIYDTARGTNKRLYPFASNAEFTGTQEVTAFNSNGFTMGSEIGINGGSGQTYVSWTFRKQPKFFDVVTYTGNGSNRTIAHNLGSVPGCIIVKVTNTSDNWQVYHRANTIAPATDYLVLNATNATADDDTRWNDTLPTSTTFSLGTSSAVNGSGNTYVAYLFAHDAGGFGLTGLDNVVSCGHYTSTDGSPITVTLGYEPQWILVKSTGNSSASWNMFDVMRGWPVSSAGQQLRANTSAAETSETAFSPTATGFIVGAGSNQEYNESGGYRYIYIAIRRGPMKVPTSGTQVFAVNTETEVRSNSSNWTSLSGFPVDLFVTKKVLLTDGTRFIDRLRTYSLTSSNTDAEVAAVFATFDTNNGVKMGPVGLSGSSTTYADYLFRRAPGFFDEVCYTGNGVSGRTLNHNLTVTPELLIIKSRNITNTWNVQTVAAGWNKFGYLSSDQAFGTDSFLTADPTSTALFLQSFAQVNGSGNTYVAYLFATVAGVSKVGSYTGTGTTQTINCGFTAGARFVMIKRTDSTGDWYVWDSARGIVAGDDPYLLLNSTAAEVTNTDFVDTASTGFEISSTAPAAINANGGTFIFLAIA